jgi:hypothetical protein
MRRNSLVLTLGALVALVSARPLAAQLSCSASGCAVTNTASVTVGTKVRLAISSNATALTVPTIADFDNAAGVLDNGPLLTVKANRPWTVKISANTAAWGYVDSFSLGGAAPVKSAGELLWSTTSGSGYAAASNATPATVFSGNGTAGTSQNVYYQVMWNSATDRPGDYSLQLDYTITTP